MFVCFDRDGNVARVVSLVFDLFLKFGRIRCFVERPNDRKSPSGLLFDGSGFVNLDLVADIDACGDDFVDFLFWIMHGAQTDGHEGQGREVAGRVARGVAQWVDGLRIRDGGFYFTPCCLIPASIPTRLFPH